MRETVPKRLHTSYGAKDLAKISDSDIYHFTLYIIFVNYNLI
jgi:hypothetical protein